MGLCCCKKKDAIEPHPILSTPTPIPFELSADKIIGPDYQPSMRVPVSDLAGKVHKLTMHSRDSTIYPGIAQLDRDKLLPGEGPYVHIDVFAGVPSADAQMATAKADTPALSEPGEYERSLRVFVPDGISPNEPCPILLINDGASNEAFAEFVGGCCMCCLASVCCNTRFRTAARGMRVMPSHIKTVATLIQQNRLPPNLVVICVNSGKAFKSPKADGQGSQRGLEYDTVSPDYGEFVEKELLPFVSSACAVTLSSDPDKRAVVGYSTGGAAAFTLAWHHPDKWGRALCGSATFCNQQYPFRPSNPNGAWDYHSGTKIIENASAAEKAKRKNLRVGLYSMERDIGSPLPADSNMNWSAANHNLALVLKKEGYTCRHVHCLNAFHCDPRAVAEYLPEALEWLWAKDA